MSRNTNRLSMAFNGLSILGFAAALAGGAAIDWRWSLIVGGVVSAVAGMFAAIGVEQRGEGGGRK